MVSLSLTPHNYTTNGSSPIAHILGHLEKVKPSGTGWEACCPAHDDTRRSLTIGEGRDGKVLLKCHAGCDVADIVQAVGLKLQDLFPEDGQAVAPEGRIVSTYEYRDADGKLLFQTVRKDPKDFVQRRPDGKGGWIWNLKGTKRVLYLLPTLLAADPNKPVFIPEGEKDVNRLIALGLVATCNPGGAGKWQDTYSEHLRGRQCVILSDNDEPGRKHAEQVAASLLRAGASAKILELPDLPPKGDVSDWLDAGGDAEQLLALADAAQEVDVSRFSRFSILGKQENEKNQQFHLTELSDMLAEPEQVISYLVEGLLPEGGVSLLAAKPKVGKSTIARELCLTVSRGECFLNRASKQGPVVYLALEEIRSGVSNHFRRMGASDEPIYIHIGSSPQEAMQALKDAIEKYQPGLVVIDPIIKLVRLRDANDYAEVSKALEPLIDIARQTNTHLLCLHHLGKTERVGGDAGDSILGSTALLGAVDTALIMKRKNEVRTLATIQRYGSDMAETVVLMDPETGRVSLGGDFEATQIEEMSKQVTAAIGTQTLTEKEIRDQVGGNSGLCGKAIRQLVKDGVLVRTGEGKRGDAYKYSIAKPESPVE